MAERVRVDDQYRDSVGSPATSQRPDVYRLEADDIPLTDPSTQTTTLTYTVAAKAATADQSSTAAVTIPEDNVTITSVTYTPVGSVAAPTSGNSRTYTLTGNEGTIATFTFDNTKSFTAATPVTFTISHAAVTEETLNFASAHAGTGVADPGGTLSVTYTF